jgi:protein farnesyltransferase subunit beta
MLTDSTGQTFEGGLSGSPGTEAHGAYAFCVLACLCILNQPDAILE